MKHLLLAFVLSGSFNFVEAQGTIVQESGKVSFIIKNAGINVNGSIGGLETKIYLDQENPALNKIEGSVDVNTISTGIGIRDKHLKRSDYFDVKKSPKITIVSSNIQKSAARKYRGTFDITIKGITKSVNIPFTFLKTGNRCIFKGEFTINRLDFSVGEGSIMLADVVKVKVEISGNIQEHIPQ